MKIEKNRKQKGSVLLTVVFVMAILIVFLFGTMSLAIAASNRSHVNYSSAQTSVTARTVAESAILALANNSDEGKEYAKAICDLKQNMEPRTVGVQISQGASNVAGIGDISDVTIEHVGTTKFFDPVSKNWEERDVLKFTASVEMGGVISTSSVYVVKHLEQDKITDAGGGAGFVTTAGATLKTQTSIYGGAYISLPNQTYADNYVYVDDYDTRMATRTFRMNIAGDDGIPKIEGDFELNNSAAVIEADLFVNNDMFIQNWSGIVFPGEKTGVTVLGDLSFHNNAKSHFNYIMAPENKFTANADNTVNFVDMPYVYVDGKIFGDCIKLGNGGEGRGPQGGPGHGPHRDFDSQDFPLNTFCGSISTMKADGSPLTNDNIIINSNLYCMDKGATSYIVSNNPTRLLQFADSTFNQTPPKGTGGVKGEICSNGNLVLQNVVIDGDVRVAGTLTIKGRVTVNGNIVAKDIEEDEGATLICNGGTIYRDDVAEGTEGETINLTIPNMVGYLYDFTPEKFELEDGSVEYRGFGGKPLNDSYAENGKLKDEAVVPPTIYYVMSEGHHAFEGSAVLESNEYGEYEENIHYFYEGSEDYNKYAISNDAARAGFIREYGDVLDPEAVVHGFYYETSDIKNFQPAAAELPEGFEKATADDGNEYMFQREVIYENILEKEYETVDVQAVITNNVNSTAAYLEGRNEKNIYPDYALRDAVLGLNGKDDTKIVKTIQEIIKKVDPYNPSDMPDGLTETGYASSAPKSYPETAGNVKAALAEDMGLLVAEDKLPGGYTKLDVNKYDLNGRTFYKVIKSDYEENRWNDLMNDAGSESVATLITKDCVLNGNGTEQDLFKNVYIDPADKSIIIGVKKVGFPASSKIFVNDKNGGKVYFYIENGGNLNFNRTSLLTDSYWDLLSNNSKVSFDSTKADTVKIESLGELMKPNVFIFGANGSNMTLTNMNVITAYIKSPGIKTTVSGNEPFTGLDELYYHNYEVLQHAKPTVIGCFNVQDVTSENPVNTIYIPQEKKSDEDLIIQVGEYWYVPYYYSEF